MATKPDDVIIDRAVALRNWLEELQLPPRVINPLRRDLELLLVQREGVGGKGGVLAGMDQAQFVAELYYDEGGLIRRIPAVGALVIEALREVIPARKVDPAPAPMAVEDEGWRDFDLDDLVAHPAEPEVAPPDAPPVPAPPKRRGRPRREDRAVAQSPLHPAVMGLNLALAAMGDQPKRRGRPRKVGADGVAPGSAAPTVQAEVPAPAPAPTAETEEAQLRQFWRQLHPHGRRAVLSYIAEQLVLQA